jgi:hypothetical protein
VPLEDRDWFNTIVALLGVYFNCAINKDGKKNRHTVNKRGQILEFIEDYINYQWGIQRKR